MSEEQDVFKFNTGVIGYPLLFVLIIWIVFWFEIRFGFDFNYLGVNPRTFLGLRGIFLSPFIHADITHLWHNTLPLLILSSALFYFYQSNAWKVMLVGLLLTGVFTWLLGRPANHIGASGVIYMLFGFLFFKGIVAKHFRLIALSLIVVFIYGSMVMYVLPIDPKISWEGHLSGLVSGAGLAFFIKKGIAKPKLYTWQSETYDPEEDEFLKHFDEDGNFIENIPEDFPEVDITITYDYTDKSNNQKGYDKDSSL
ncbi:rhomboid family intramembrane serine protease [Aquimarina sp. AD10]|uniref:rhomboid family intramembrane serine protease n=1 Tax=Aquimarina sp. AD10 TaxID=1714849 RepID=UPI000E4B21E8|nr:rhomboid family intramembrane serine protease [Aquimarina sp. AD10]AXT62916.1 rhomboid family intramembrane serine protease [Aquimarina sp. AD10]RKM94637.1 rhomboid family intramembrane serine protease [Aquimarina sp. AD10]